MLTTKLYIEMDEWPNYGGLSALNIRRACEASLRRLNTDHIDLYQFHHIDRSAPGDEVWEATERLVADGKIIYAGSSNFAGWHIAQANEAARRRNFLGLVSEQSPYNLMERTIELEVLPACQAYGLGLLPWSPLAGDCSLERGRRQNRAAAPTMICCSATLPESSASPRTARGYRNTRASVANWGRSQLMWRWPGCSHNLVSPPR